MLCRRQEKSPAYTMTNCTDFRSCLLYTSLQKAREEALAELEQRAGAMGANAVIGVDIDYEVLGADNGMLMVTASGTAVVVD